MQDYIMTLAAMVLCSIAAITDMKGRRVPNKLTFSFFGFGLVMSVIFFRQDIVRRLLFEVVLFFFGMTNALGMGDLKLLMALCMIKGTNVTIETFIAGIFLLLFFCFLENPWMTIRTLKEAFFFLLSFGKQKMDMSSEKKYPFAVFLAFGYAFTMLHQILVTAGILGN